MKSAIYKENYIVYEDGRVYNIKLNRFLNIYDDGRGYDRVSINGKHIRLHVLVSICFIPNPKNKPQVNHIDGNKKNNHVSNLEWVTHSENQRHAWDNGLKVNVIKALNNKSEQWLKNNANAMKFRDNKWKENVSKSAKKRFSKPLLNTQTGIYYDSITDAAKSSHIRLSALKAMLNGQNKNKSSFIYI